MRNRVALLITVVSLAAAQGLCETPTSWVDFSSSAITLQGNEAAMARAAALLQTEIEERSGVRLAISSEPSGEAPLITLEVGKGGTPEGYSIRVERSPRLALRVIGNDLRGVVFGAGRLVRLLYLDRGVVLADPEMDVTAAPVTPLRGHQVAYRSLVNTFDAWDFDAWHEYIRDQIILGCNAIELRSANDIYDELDSPHMVSTKTEMNRRLSELIGEYGLEFWLYVELPEDVSDPATEEEVLRKHRAIFRNTPHLAGVFVPGGDPGDTPPEVLMPFLEKMAGVLHEEHPKALLQVSNQGFTPEQNDFFFAYMEEHDVSWLGGVVFAPWAKCDFAEERRRTPESIPVRRYPDITHTLRCQYPVSEWNIAFGILQGREPICPRFHDFAHIYKLFEGLADGGFLTYSEGVNDDANKAVFSLLGWDDTLSAEAMAREYASAFIGDRFAETGQKALLMLEDSWKGDPAANQAIPEARALWTSLLEEPDLQDNWRVQLYCFRALFDDWVRQKVIAERGHEVEALAALAAARETGWQTAVERARTALGQADGPVDPELRKAIEDLALRLFNRIGFQPATAAPFLAHNSERGAVLDKMDEPVTNRSWIESELDALASLPSDGARLARIDAIVHWEDAGEGGSYDNLGCAGRQQHLVHQMPWESDPGRVHSPREGVDGRTQGKRLSWIQVAETLFGTPLLMRYDGLDKDAQYVLRVTYAGRYRPTMTLTADGMREIHGALAMPQPIAPLNFLVPKEATADGRLQLRWNLVEKRGCQVGEVWLMRVDTMPAHFREAGS